MSYSTGLWDSVRYGVGSFYFDPIETTSAGHIGAFYFGPEYVEVSADTALIEVIAFEPEVSSIISVSANVVVPTALLTLIGTIPDVYITNDLKIDFSGVPVIGSSPLTVKFKSWITYKGSYTNIYKVKEWIWYFDYENHPDKYETTTEDEIYHVYHGYKGQKYTVKLEVKLEKK